MNSTKLIVWDVEHGSAAYIQSPNGKHIVIDAGSGSFKNGRTFSPLYHLYNRYGVQSIDYAIITHPHKDHIDDIRNLIALSPSVLWRPKHLTREDIIPTHVSEDDRQLFEEYIAFCNEYNETVTEQNSPLNPENYGGLLIKCFSTKSCSKSNLNNQSPVFIFEYASIKIVVTGDNESANYRALFDENPSFRGSISNADVLIAAHHGRESGYDNDFVSTVNPRLTIISDSSKKDTSASSYYSQKSRGLTVHTKNGDVERKTLSTYKDGCINVEFGKGILNSNYLSVKI